MGSSELHVLAVDDSHVDRRLIERLLKISSCRVTVVESGQSALRYLGLDKKDQSSVEFQMSNDLEVNLVMTDYSMPGMTGYELLKKIKESTTMREVPVVIMSSENIITRIDRCLEGGAEEFLMKPVKLSDVERLKDFILRALRETNGVGKNRKRKHQDCLAYDRSSYSEQVDLQPSLLSPTKRPKMLHRL